jgi:hypothetical protein
MDKIIKRWKAPMSDIGVILAQFVPFINITVGVAYELCEYLSLAPNNLISVETKATIAFISTGCLLIGKFTKK